MIDFLLLFIIIEFKRDSFIADLLDSISFCYDSRNFRVINISDYKFTTIFLSNYFFTQIGIILIYNFKFSRKSAPGNKLKTNFANQKQYQKEESRDKMMLKEKKIDF